ncbi:AAA family ATPase [Vagococcus fluvialis]|uniref:AAA family ATPase n=1 Tax=Vagococcus fluvialis TaxID=2738 RepID=UPI001D0B610A|nr:AAA family ATPase [Vagococcus fluvialis]UDM72658.1 AAA family ATPase [Vagococcus fluvialis]UDM78381.1 AAA family ATPase [Vagococcus fluvialis]UDM83933.1 AAA family ATPase [Vagococcus fluvialis]
MDETLVKIHILSGVPASGKSTFVKSEVNRINNKTDGFAVYISSDEIRSSLLEDGKIMSSKDEGWKSLNNKVFEKMFNAVIESILSNYNSKEINLTDVFYDSTNLSLKFRKQLFERFKARLNKEGVKCLICIDVLHQPLSVLLDRNSKRSDMEKVSSDRVREMYFSHQPPLEGVDCDVSSYHGENYFKVVNFTECYSIKDIVDSMKNSSLYEEIAPVIDMPHDCKPHHFESVSEHIDMVHNLSKKVNILIPVAFLHDLGKPVTKTFIENGKAHYRNHSNVGAMYSYICLQNNVLFSKEEKMDILKTILFHMVAHNVISEKMRVKYKISDHQMNLLDTFSKYDSLGRITTEMY